MVEVRNEFLCCGVSRVAGAEIFLFSLLSMVERSAVLSIMLESFVLIENDLVHLVTLHNGFNGIFKIG